jgi:hypothetical protein
MNYLPFRKKSDLSFSILFLFSYFNFNHLGVNSVSKLPSKASRRRQFQSPDSNGIYEKSPIRLANGRRLLGSSWKETVFPGLNRRKIIYYEVLEQENKRMNFYGSLAKKSL